jgi:hypothetical protein
MTDSNLKCTCFDVIPAIKQPPGFDVMYKCTKCGGLWYNSPDCEAGTIAFCAPDKTPTRPSSVSVKLREKVAAPRKGVPEPLTEFQSRVERKEAAIRQSAAALDIPLGSSKDIAEAAYHQALRESMELGYDTQPMSAFIAIRPRECNFNTKIIPTPTEG